jgi:PAS domain S-box-containing protein
MNSRASRSTQFSKSLLFRYGLAILVTAAALLLRAVLDPYLGNYTPFVTMFPTIVLLAAYVGLGPSILSVLLGLFGVTYWFVPPRHSFAVWEHPAYLIATVVYLIFGAVMVLGGEWSRRSRVKLRRTRVLFETFLDNSPGAEYLKDENGTYVYANKTNKTRFASDFVGKTDFDIFPQAIAQQFREHDLLVLRDNQPREFIERTDEADGLHTWLTVKFPVIDADGERLIGGKSIDITEKQRAEDALRTTSAQFRRFLETAPVGLVRCGRDTRYLAANPAYAEIVGIPLDQIVGRLMIEVMGAEAFQQISPSVDRVLKGERVEYEALLPYRSGSRHVHVVWTPDMDSSNQIVGWIASVLDVTEAKRAEEHLHKVEKLAAAGQLAASLAHEINNPLSSVINALYLLKGQPALDGNARFLVNTAGTELQRVARIVKQSLSYYREGSTRQPMDLTALAEDSLQVFSEKIRHAGIEVTKKLTPDTTIVGFADEVRQVIDNLLLNAVEASPNGGRLIVCVRPSRDWRNLAQAGARLTIADTGNGIPSESIARVFEPFFTTKPEKGTGLGLWVVRGILAKHGGQIKIRSSRQESKSGTVISILWPMGKLASQGDDVARSQTVS